LQVEFTGGENILVKLTYEECKFLMIEK
jgi:hypothetical protein